ncbi:hypothetical protein HYALB_00007559 [Hymenoscyphus albidus]|uniref:Uncharacterized protein n=1 Tax=Hymenoscyphus albidus TaxID=595503 RepID=A0A9N9LMZ1_9HELO|nr:hypothetical protein HYALB_00007559 [Hymenoscyphus albidus]
MQTHLLHPSRGLQWRHPWRAQPLLHRVPREPEAVDDLNSNERTTTETATESQTRNIATLQETSSDDEILELMDLHDRSCGAESVERQSEDQIYDFMGLYTRLHAIETVGTTKPLEGHVSANISTQATWKKTLVRWIVNLAQTLFHIVMDKWISLGGVLSDIRADDVAVFPHTFHFPLTDIDLKEPSIDSQISITAREPNSLTTIDYECRYKILEYLLVSPIPIKPRLRNYSETPIKNPRLTDIATVCQLLRDDAYNIFLTRNKFYFELVRVQKRKWDRLIEYSRANIGRFFDPSLYGTITTKSLIPQIELPLMQEDDWAKLMHYNHSTVHPNRYDLPRAMKNTAALRYPRDSIKTLNLVVKVPKFFHLCQNHY